MSVIRVYDPAMCCSTGVCGPDADDTLAQFAAALDRARKSGATVDRFTLGHQPGEYVTNPAVKGLLDSEGIDCLPLVFVDGELVSKAGYPSRAELLGRIGLDPATAPAGAAAPCCGPAAKAETKAEAGAGASGGCCG